LAIALPPFLTTSSFIPFLYPLYYVALLLPRSHSDSIICEKKYGKELWNTYKNQVPYSVIPYLH
jgi:hypothetical protein